MGLRTPGRPSSMNGGSGGVIGLGGGRNKRRGLTMMTTINGGGGTTISRTSSGDRASSSSSISSSSPSSSPPPIGGGHYYYVPITSNRRISQSTLHRIFVIMMSAVFGIYAVLSAYLIRQGHTSRIFETTEGKFGPSLMNNDRILKEHMESLRHKAATTQQLESTDAANAAAVVANAETDINRGGGQQQQSQNLQTDHLQQLDVTAKIDTTTSNDNNNNNKLGTRSKRKIPPKQNVEEVDIHEMKHPNDISKIKSGNFRSSPSSTNGVVAAAAAAVAGTANNHDRHTNQGSDGILRAYLEPISMEDLETKPLPIRNTTKSSLRVVEYPRVTSCQHLVEQWPIDDYPNDDPFLPWIHDVFPTDDGRHIQFIAQNKRRCQTGTTPDQIKILEDMQPQVSLFQHVPVQRIKIPTTTTTTTTTDTKEEIRYKLTTHEMADPDGIETRFICQFLNGQETLSRFNFNYDYVGTRKHFKKIHTQEGNKDIKSLHTSQLIFQCPVPSTLIQTVRDGTSVINDQATLFVSLIPIRTPPRYGKPDRFLPPQYQNQGTHQNFSVVEEWGHNYILPKIEDSGRWENIPICLPTSKAYPTSTTTVIVDANPSTSTDDTKTNTNDHHQDDIKSILKSTRNTKKNRLVACTWAATSYATRGDRFAIDDGARRLDEWIRFYLLTGFDHIYVYDNSQQGENTLQPVTDQFDSEHVTRIPWPATICNNNRNFDDSPGERSSQYAAESSCRLRFGPHTDWMANIDIDEYITPVGSYKSLKPYLDTLDDENTKIISFGSWRAWPRRDLIEPPVPINDQKVCDEPYPCFHLKVPKERSVLQTYNCDRQIVKTEKMPAEKQIFRTDYVLQHFVHFSTVTRFTVLNQTEVFEVGKTPATKVAPDPFLRFADELSEVTMLHTKAIATQDTSGWQKRCTGEMKRGYCRIGVPYPDMNTSSTVLKDDKGWIYNCYVNPIIENFWVPLLDKELVKSNIRG